MPEETHLIWTHATAFGWGWSCECGRHSKGVGAQPTQRAAYSAAEKHIRRLRRLEEPK